MAKSKVKGKRFAKRVNGKCRSYGQAGKAKGGGDRIRPGTKKGDAYCARSAKIRGNWKTNKDPKWWTEYLISLGIDPRNP